MAEARNSRLHHNNSSLFLSATPEPAPTGSSGTTYAYHKYNERSQVFDAAVEQANIAGCTEQARARADARSLSPAGKVLDRHCDIHTKPREIRGNASCVFD
jgi:hypothetical protein